MTKLSEMQWVVMAIFSSHELEGDKIPRSNYWNFHSSSSDNFRTEGYKQYNKKKKSYSVPGVLWISYLSLNIYP